jgi:hypothetical protein
MLKQSYFLLKFFREVRKSVLLKYVLLLSGRDSFSFIVEETGAFAFNNNFSWVIEKDASWLIREQVT